MNEDSSSARVNGGPTSLTNFGIIAEPPALPSVNDVLVEKGAEAPKPCPSSVEMRTPTAAGGLLPAGTASTAMWIIFSPPLPSWTPGDKIKEKPVSQTSTSLPLPDGGRLFERNPGELWCLILAVVQAVYAPARFWEGGTRCFMERFVWTPEGI